MGANKIDLNLGTFLVACAAIQTLTQRPPYGANTLEKFRRIKHFAGLFEGADKMSKVYNHFLKEQASGNISHDDLTDGFAEHGADSLPFAAHIFQIIAMLPKEKGEVLCGMITEAISEFTEQNFND